MVGVDGYRRALASIKEAAGPEVPIVNFADYDPAQLDVPAILRFQRELGIVHPDFVYPDERAYWLGERDPHLNPEGHLEITKRMLAALRASGACLAR